MVQKIALWKDLRVQPSTSIVKAIEIIDSAGLQIALVTDEAGKLLGTVTDGDIRRGILRGVALSGPVQEIMHKTPTVGQTSMSRDQLFDLFQNHGIRQIPVVDEKGVVQGLYVLEDFLNRKAYENPVVIMAGGLGRRLYPLTKDTPKPMLKVGSKPILENILESFVTQGFKKFYFSVNYKADVVKEHFGNGSRFGVQIQYLEEETSMGTAGSLTLLPAKSNLPMIVMNGDLLTKVNFSQLLDFHERQKAEATMCVREYEFQVPYGVVTMDSEKNRVFSIDEKPTHRFFVNGGIYVLNPEVLPMIPKGERYDMTTLFSSLIEKKRPTGAFPVREYWMDIGRLDDFEKANGEIESILK
ncbi:MAG: nucleotidyltransferase family protein [Bdellovibrionales bacterium]|nr:nucleotidyltransferase family protein [Bdellovibrionales bacterium]